MIPDANLPACPPGYFADSFAQTAARIHRAYLDILDSILAVTLQTPVTSIPLPVEQSTLGSFIGDEESAGCLHALDLSPLDGCAVLSFSNEILFRALNIFTATPASAEYNPGASVTDVELHILQEFFDVFRHALTKTWQPFYPIALGVLATDREKIRQSVSARRDQAVIILKSRIQFAERGAVVALALPGFLFRLAEARARQPQAGDSGGYEVEESLLGALGAAMLQVDAVLNGARVRMSELLRMKSGQILSLGAPPDTPFECLVNGKSRFTGEMIASGGRQAFRVETRTGHAETQSGSPPELAR